MTQIRAGASRSKITPPVGTDLAGYAYRKGPSTGVHDDLWCNVLVLDDGHTRVALVALDLLETDFEADAMLRQAAAGSAGAAAESILINCSHTHAGPSLVGLECLGARNVEYTDFLATRVSEAAATAASRLKPAVLRHGSASVRLGINRRETTPNGGVTIGRNPEGLVDARVRAIEVSVETGPGALVFHHACHGTTLGGDNREISAEWMGAAAARLAAESNGASIPVFLQGCCGQVNPDAEATFDEVGRLGAAMSAAVGAALDGAESLMPLPLAARMEQVELPFQDPLTPEEARAQLRREEAEHDRLQRKGAHSYVLRAHESLVKHAARMVERAERGHGDDALAFAVQVLRIGDLAIVGLSGEVFLEFAQEIEARSPFPHTLVLGYANGCTCYIPTEDAFAEGGYEAVDSFRWYGLPPLAPQAGGVMTTAAVGVLNDLWGGDAGR